MRIELPRYHSGPGPERIEGSSGSTRSRAALVRASSMPSVGSSVDNVQMLVR